LIAVWQILREVPPGYGGVERVAHAMAQQLGGPVFSLRRSGPVELNAALPVSYDRIWLPSWSFRRLLIPRPSGRLIRLLFSSNPLIAHLPSPEVLSLVALARLLQPRRVIWVYWHAFLQPKRGLMGCLELVYQWIALRFVRFTRVITTSPVLRDALLDEGVSAAHLHWLPCCLDACQEDQLNQIWLQRQQVLAHRPRGAVVAIGRLDSYKRVDWVIEAVARIPEVSHLHIVGEGPKRGWLCDLASQSLPTHISCSFHGRVTEERKQQILAESDLLVLASDRSNEAFGIVQLEAMAVGVPALALQLSHSGMHWVSDAMSFPGWHGLREELPGVISLLLSDSELYATACVRSRERYQNLFSVSQWRALLLQLMHADG
jgi:glycosyltransferase involved in cell wall biosynthesis